MSWVLSDSFFVRGPLVPKGLLIFVTRKCGLDIFNQVLGLHDNWVDNYLSKTTSLRTHYWYFTIDIIDTIDILLLAHK